MVNGLFLHIKILTKKLVVCLLNAFSLRLGSVVGRILCGEGMSDALRVLKKLLLGQ